MGVLTGYRLLTLIGLGRKCIIEIKGHSSGLFKNKKETLIEKLHF